MKTVKAAPSDLITDDIHMRGDTIPIDEDFINSIVESKGPIEHIECWADKQGKLHVLDGHRVRVEPIPSWGEITPDHALHSLPRSTLAQVPCLFGLCHRAQHPSQRARSASSPAARAMWRTRPGPHPGRRAAVSAIAPTQR